MKIRKLILQLALLATTYTALAQNYGNGLPATDALGRRLPLSDEAGTPRKRYVGLFYWTWHTNFAEQGVCIPSRVIADHPDAAFDYDNPAWPKDINTCFWGEPLFGLYRDTDRWVLRRHAEMLADAGVDVIFFDCTNGSFTWRESYTALCEVFAEARRDGVQTPQIAFMLAFGPTEGSRDAIKQIYLDLYKPAVYDDLFFRWQGKPLIMAYPEMLGDVEGDPEATALHREIREAGFDLLQAAPVRIHADALRRKGKGQVIRCPRCGEWYPAELGSTCRPCQGAGPYEDWAGLHGVE